MAGIRWSMYKVVRRSIMQVGFFWVIALRLAVLSAVGTADR